MCKCCEELILVNEELRVVEIYGSKTGYFQPLVDMNIKYCPVCGEKLNFSNNKSNYVNAIIKVKVPEWQIGEEVKIYFKDTMYISGICEKEDKENILTNDK